MKKKAVIISIKGFRLSKGEIQLLTNEKPWGVILFKRNIKSLQQIKDLTKKIRKISKDSKLPILIDEEGDTVSRLRKILKNSFSQKFLGDIYSINRQLGQSLYKKYLRKLFKILKMIGVNINTVPVLDVLRETTSKVIGNRSFSYDPKIVKELGQFCVNQYKLNKLGTVIKHIPGHGCASSDSHLMMPKVNLNLNTLNYIDFEPFKQNRSRFAMTAHILYKKIDNKYVATFSKKIVKNIIRKKIGFKGILISDDISMKALKYDILKNAKMSLSAGCNIVLYCGANFKDSHKLLKALPFIDKFTAKKHQNSTNF